MPQPNADIAIIGAGAAGLATAIFAAQRARGRRVMLFDGAEAGQLAQLGETRTPGLADLFVATMKGTYA